MAASFRFVFVLIQLNLCDSVLNEQCVRECVRANTHTFFIFISVSFIPQNEDSFFSSFLIVVRGRERKAIDLEVSIRIMKWNAAEAERRKQWT